jgi:hypothetical protein
MFRRRDVKGSNRREGAKANTAEKLGNDGSAGPRQRQGPNRLHVISRSVWSWIGKVLDVLESLPCFGPVDTQAYPFEPSRGQKGWTGSR